MEYGLVFAAGALVSSVATRWYDRYQRSKLWPKVVSHQLGTWTVLSVDSGNPIHIIEARWGTVDITQDMRKFCEDTSHIEFAGSENMLNMITEDKFIISHPEQSLYIKYE